MAERALCIGIGIGNTVTPITSSTAIEQSGWFDQMERTRIGSPFVVSAMALSQVSPIAGLEANSGILLGSDLELSRGTLSALPTRNAVLPLVGILSETVRRDCDLSMRLRELPSRVVKVDLLKNVLPSLSHKFLDAVAQDDSFRVQLWDHLAAPEDIDLTDSVRFQAPGGEIVHFRASGNAPELRLYVEADNDVSAARLLSTLLSRLAKTLKQIT